MERGRIIPLPERGRRERGRKSERERGRDQVMGESRRMGQGTGWQKSSSTSTE